MSRNVEPVYVQGRGWVVPKGWRSPETQALIDRVAAQSQRDLDAMNAKGGPQNQPPQTGFVVDPLNTPNPTKKTCHSA